MADKGNDPAAIWQTMLGEMEKGFNSFANQAMTSPEFSKAMNLPSRAQMAGMAERLQSIEGQLNEIKAMLHQVHHNSLSQDGGLGTPRPPRTKRPPTEGEQK